MSAGNERADALRAHFLGWQCRIRQVAMRQDGGRPSPGMRPRVLDLNGRELAAAMTVLLVPEEPAESTAFFRFQALKSADPRDVYERALAYLQADYFQRPETFSDMPAAVLLEGSALAARLLEDGACHLEFDQFRQTYRLPCAVHELAADETARDAAVWHNRLFNPALPGTLHVLGFQPDWASAEANPGPGGRSAFSPQNLR
ncbi:MAG: hypothetical protein ACR2J1_08460 [Methyloceanibacter sp.]|uniref:hypothetical protein n=1 Tax=Methyloceanibacter sp. TaxID=1965321 RepID=UPI003D9ADE29